MADAVLDFNSPANVRASGRMSARLRAVWRLWHIRRSQRARLRAVLAGTADPRLIKDVGLTPPQASELELFVLAQLPRRL